ncbi:hypothetical protein KP509_29G071500 [Ceratopteris richardii]|uniref:Uncharacterized protein n=1 Tax=Ceratopteris richardii TaxID=49495 RepID=A0A8T2R813_CERRI|nr:hypothetical protein KP509_29G071500 [Ceratopteris richardii]
MICTAICLLSHFMRTTRICGTIPTLVVDMLILQQSYPWRSQKVGSFDFIRR